MRTRRSNYPNSNVTIPRRRRQVSNIVEPEIRTIVAPMAERTMEELLRAPTEGYGEAIVLPEINADHFEIKTNLLQLVQANPFYGRTLQSVNPSEPWNRGIMPTLGRSWCEHTILCLFLLKKASYLNLPQLGWTLEVSGPISITDPKGSRELFFVKVGKFHFPTDFVVVEFEADLRVPLRLGAGGIPFCGSELL
ncbi:hypothetical protein Tco_0823658 [Tanacetum coccineum]|uniref:Reverse transcriptase domain-containing protein n=1 Tax=Tanacetum coccineum TaxID=301880 RepID=A0ABQ5AN53_9ASTR